MFDFVRARRRKSERKILWDKGPVILDVVTAREAPIAYEVSTTLRSGLLECFAIRLFDGRLFWPVPREERTTTVGEFSDGVEQGSTALLRLMHPAVAAVYSNPKMSEEEFRRTVSVRKMLKNARGMGEAS